MDFQQVPLVAALVETHTSLGELDEVILRFFQLEHIHIRALVDGTCVEQKLVGRDAEQGLGHLPDALLIEVLQVLTGQNDRRLLFPHTFKAVAYVLDSRGI